MLPCRHTILFFQEIRALCHAMPTGREFPVMEVKYPAESSTWAMVVALLKLSSPACVGYKPVSSEMREE